MPQDVRQKITFMTKIGPFSRLYIGKTLSKEVLTFETQSLSAQDIVISGNSLVVIAIGADLTCSTCQVALPTDYGGNFVFQGNNYINCNIFLSSRAMMILQGSQNVLARTLQVFSGASVHIMGGMLTLLHQNQYSDESVSIKAVAESRLTFEVEKITTDSLASRSTIELFGIASFRSNTTFDVDFLAYDGSKCEFYPQNVITFQRRTRLVFSNMDLPRFSTILFPSKSQFDLIFTSPAKINGMIHVQGLETPLNVEGNQNVDLNGQFYIEGLLTWTKTGLVSGSGSILLKNQSKLVVSSQIDKIEIAPNIICEGCLVRVRLGDNSFHHLNLTRAVMIVDTYTVLRIQKVLICDVNSKITLVNNTIHDPMAVAGLLSLASPENCQCHYCFQPTCFGVSSQDIKVCSSHGACKKMSKCDCHPGYKDHEAKCCFDNGICECSPGYTGDKCQYPVCFGLTSNDPRVCGKSGTCVGPNQCKCTEEYTGEQCQYPICFGSSMISTTKPCSGNGTCSSPSKCDCKLGWTGSFCEDILCFGKASRDSGVCSGKSSGSCMAPNVCFCKFGWTGKECETPMCGSGTQVKNCNQRGQCLKPGECRCDSGYSGSNCECLLGFFGTYCTQEQSFPIMIFYMAFSSTFLIVISLFFCDLRLIASKYRISKKLYPTHGDLKKPLLLEDKLIQ